MSLPFILDIAIGLIFIYLILSLLASEIQELISTLLQWRAKHLKNSIETLLAGGSEGSDNKEVLAHARELANHLYNDPLINTLNYEEKGLLGTFFRSLFNFFSNKADLIFSQANRLVNGQTSNTLNKNSAPSYIPNETFSTSLLETLKIPEVVHILSQESLENFQQQQLSQIESYIDLIKADQNINPDDSSRICIEEFQKLKDSFKEIHQDLQNHRASLKTSITRMIDQLNIYIEHAQDVLPEESPTKRRFIKQLQLLRKNTFSNTTEAVWQGGVQPNLTMIINGYKEVKDGVIEENNPIHQKINDLTLIIAGAEEKLIDKLPKSLTDSLVVLANRAQIKIDDAEEGMNQFKKEIETWFDRSMNRSQGVYKRNAKGVAIIIGFLISAAANADTIHIVSMLSKDSTLRAAITQNSGQAAQSCTSSPDAPNNLKCLIREVDQALTDSPSSIPLGWSDSNIKQQIEWLESNPNNNSIKSTSAQPLNKAQAILIMIIGWILSSLAIGMGAPFWFELLSKVINVRNTGSKPTSSSESEK